MTDKNQLNLIKQFKNQDKRNKNNSIVNQIILKNQNNLKERSNIPRKLIKI